MKRFYKIKILFCLLMFAVLLQGCNNSTNQNKNFEETVNNLIINTEFDKKLAEYEVKDQYERDFIEKIYNAETNNVDFVYKKENENIKDKAFHNQITTYKIADIIKLDINTINVDDKKNVLSYINMYISPKVEVLYNDIKLVTNIEDKQAIYGTIIIKNKNLSEEEKAFFKKYSEQFNKKIKYDAEHITILFNKD